MVYLAPELAVSWVELGFSILWIVLGGLLSINAPWSQKSLMF